MKRKSKIETGVVYAIKKTDRAPAYMPSEVIILLDGEKTGKLLITCGWTMTTSAKDKSCTKWPVDRLRKNLGRILEEWQGDFGKSWKLEIRSTV